MAIWLVRAGSQGEYEQKFIQEKQIYVTWEEFKVNISKLADRSALAEKLNQNYPDTKPKTIQNWVSQLWPFAHDMKKGDLVILESAWATNDAWHRGVGYYSPEENTDFRRTM